MQSAAGSFVYWRCSFQRKGRFTPFCPGVLTARIVQFSRHGEGHVMGRTDALDAADAVLGMDIAP
jgi:hypothetical protein